MLEPSLSLVLPVHNAQAVLVQRVLEALDVAMDLTAQFEVLVVDDGSTDHTEEIARELARQYPQLRCTRHGSRRGVVAAVRTGLAEAAGDVVMVQDENAAVSGTDLTRLWHAQGRASSSQGDGGRPAQGPLATWGQLLQKATSPLPAPSCRPAFSGAPHPTDRLASETLV